MIGGGPIGCEYAQLVQRLGSQVTLVQRGDHLLPRDEPEASAAVAQAFAADGVEVSLDAEPTRVERRGETRVVRVAVRGEERVVEAEAILVAAGRLPNVEALNLGAAGVASTKHGIPTDARMRTSQPHLSAIGDVAGKGLFTHVAAEQGGIAAGAILGKRGRSSARRVLVYVHRPGSRPRRQTSECLRCWLVSVRARLIGDVTGRLFAVLPARERRRTTGQRRAVCLRSSTRWCSGRGKPASWSPAWPPRPASASQWSIVRPTAAPA